MHYACTRGNSYCTCGMKTLKPSDCPLIMYQLAATNVRRGTWESLEILGSRPCIGSVEPNWSIGLLFYPQLLASCTIGKIRSCSLGLYIGHWSRVFHVRMSAVYSMSACPSFEQCRTNHRTNHRTKPHQRSLRTCFWLLASTRSTSFL